nr:hypothetical protein [Microvirga tunisiensis]
MDYDRSDADKLEAVVREAERLGIAVLPPDINVSTATFDPEGNHAIRFPLAGLSGISGSTAADVVRNRTLQGPFRSASDAVARLFETGLNRAQIVTLIDAGAFDPLIDHSSRERRFDLREIVSDMTGGKVDRSAPSLFEDLQSETAIDAERRLRRQALAQGKLPPPPPQAVSEEIEAETKAIGFRLRNHPADAYKILSYRIAASPVSAVGKVRNDTTFTVIAQIEAIYPAKDRRPAGIDATGVELIISDSSGRIRAFAESPTKAPQAGDVAVLQLVSRNDGRVLSSWQTPDEARKTSSPAVVVQADSRLTATPARELETQVKTSIRLYGKGGTYRLVYFNAGPVIADGHETQQNEIKTLFNRVNPTAEFIQSVEAIDGVVSVAVEA